MKRISNGGCSILLKEKNIDDDRPLNILDWFINEAGGIDICNPKCVFCNNACLRNEKKCIDVIDVDACMDCISNLMHKIYLLKIRLTDKLTSRYSNDLYPIILNDLFSLFLSDLMLRAEFYFSTERYLIEK
jgi:hypothetical protein